MKVSLFFTRKTDWFKRLKGELNKNPLAQIFVDRYMKKVDYDSWVEVCSTNPEAFLFFLKNIRLPILLQTSDPSFDSHSAIELDLMTAFYVWFLSSNPTKVLAMRGAQLGDHFESGAYIEELKGCFLLRQECLTKETQDLLINDFHYRSDIVKFVFSYINLVSEEKKTPIGSYVANNAYIQNEIGAGFFRYYQSLAGRWIKK